MWRSSQTWTMPTTSTTLSIRVIDPGPPLVLEELRRRDAGNAYLELATVLPMCFEERPPHAPLRGRRATRFSTSVTQRIWLWSSPCEGNGEAGESKKYSKSLPSDRKTYWGIQYFAPSSHCISQNALYCKLLPGLSLCPGLTPSRQVEDIRALMPCQHSC